MCIPSDSELRAFGQFVAELAESRKRVTPERALLWRQMRHMSPEELDEEVAAIKEALDDMEAGDKGRPFEEVLAEIDAEFELNVDDNCHLTETNLYDQTQSRHQRRRWTHGEAADRPGQR